MNQIYTYKFLDGAQRYRWIGIFGQELKGGFDVDFFMLFIGVEEVEKDKFGSADLALDEVILINSIIEKFIHKLLLMYIFILLDRLQFFLLLMHKHNFIILILKIPLYVGLMR